MSDPHRLTLRLFGSLLSRQLEHLVERLIQIDLPANTVIFHEGDHGNHFYLVLQGAVEVIKALGTGDERTLTVFGPGECFGEMAHGGQPAGNQTSGFRCDAADSTGACL